MKYNRGKIQRRSFLVIFATATKFTGCLESDDEPDEESQVPDDTSEAGEDEDESDEPDEDEDEADPSESRTVNGETFVVEHITEDLVYPWAIEFIPNSDQIIVTEREGDLLVIDRNTGEKTQISIPDLPPIHVRGHAGLLDVELHPNYPDENWLYLTYVTFSDENSDKTSTEVARGRLDISSQRLEDLQILYTAEPFLEEPLRHYGSRVIFGEDSKLYVTTGDRADKDFGPDHVSQDLTNDLGATLRLNPDGSIPDDNPFVDTEDATDAVYTYGQRNSQGMTIHPETGEIWQSEHGEVDGDEINVIQKGGNYGWPIAHYGCEYETEQTIGDQPHERDDVVDPIYYWECQSGGFPPAGMTFYTGEAFPEWQGDLFIGTLKASYLGQFEVDGYNVEEIDPLLDNLRWRIRDVEEAPDTGHLYVAVDNHEAPILRLKPA